jgi:hypothetical protein
MKIAIVLFGQPRDYVTGYNNIMNFIKQHTDCSFDFFYHCWTLNEGQSYNTSPWRKIDKNTLIYKNEIITDLQNLYNPCLCEYENQNQVSFDDSIYKNTIAYNNTSGLALSNIDNTLFHMYSRNKARNLLDTYLKKMDYKIHYDFVIMMRFDIGFIPKINLNELNISYTYLSDMHLPRNIIPDIFIITPTKIFLEWFNIYESLNYTLNNKGLYENMLSLNEKLYINAEELIFAKYIFHYKNTDNIKYFIDKK